MVIDNYFVLLILRDEILVKLVSLFSLYFPLFSSDNRVSTIAENSKFKFHPQREK
jgi:hypothetical protein